MTRWAVLAVLCAACSVGPSYPEGLEHRAYKDLPPGESPISACAKAGGVLVNLAGPGNPNACIRKEAVIYYSARYE